MTGFWGVLLPSTSAITNLCTNPSIETVTTGYAAVSGGTAAAATTKSRRGSRRITDMCPAL